VFRKSISAMFITLLLAACMGNPRIENMTSAQRAKSNNIKIYQTDVDKPYINLGEVSGLSCNRNKYQVQDVSNNEAIQGVRLKAAMLNADAVINTFCQKNSDIDMYNNCWASGQMGSGLTIQHSTFPFSLINTD